MWIHDRTDITKRHRGDSVASRPRQTAAWKDAGLSRDEQFAAKRAAVITEAARAFSTGGYHSTSLDDVAQQLGVTKTALYYYVSSKEEILYACHIISCDLGDEALALAHAQDGSGLDRVKVLASKYIEMLTSRLGAFTVLTEIDALSEGNRKSIAARRSAFDRKFRALLKSGIGDGSIRPIDPKFAVFFFMGAVNWMTRWYDPSGTASSQQIAEQFTDFLVKAIRAER